jgi:putative DNA primase/helicase
VVDVDPRNGGDASYRHLRANGMPETWMAVTGGGGIHVFFRHEPATPKGVTGLLSGIDIKDTGGYVVAAPSLHRSGKSYRWVVSPRDIELAEQPPWLREMRRELARKTACVVPFTPRITRSVDANVLERARRYVARMEPAVSGQGGHNRTLHVASQLTVGFDLTDGEAMEVLADWNARCSPPWSERELLRKIHEARRTSKRAAGFLLAA